MVDKSVKNDSLGHSIFFLDSQPAKGPSCPERLPGFSISPSKSFMHLVEHLHRSGGHMDISLAPLFLRLYKGVISTVPARDFVYYIRHLISSYLTAVHLNKNQHKSYPDSLYGRGSDGKAQDVITLVERITDIKPSYFFYCIFEGTVLVSLNPLSVLAI